MKKFKTIMVVVMLITIAAATMGARGCKKDDVVKTLELTQTTLGTLVTATGMFIETYCETQDEGDQYFEVCATWPAISAATDEFLSNTLPSFVKLAEIAIPEGTKVGTIAPSIFMDAYHSLPPDQRAQIRNAINETGPHAE